MRKIDLNDFQVATSETVRDINSRIMLNLVRKHQPVSRADLMRFSGLQRSTISVIAERLIADRWLKEGAMGNLPRGRKPTFLHLNADRCAVVGVDVQPATTTLAVANTSAAGAKCGLGIAMTFIPAATPARMPLAESSITAHAGGATPSRLAASR